MSAVMAALLSDHEAAERIRTRLVTEGFPTDRVQLTSLKELGLAGTGPAEDLSDQLLDYFRPLFGEGEMRKIQTLADGVRKGHSALVIHPRGEIETRQAQEILRQGSPIELYEHELDKQDMEFAAAKSETPIVKQAIDSAKTTLKP